jgi:hypothetical protein
MTSYSKFKNIFDTYCPLLYDIALQICKSHSKAEKLLKYTFRKIHEQDIVEQKFPAFCITLMRLIIKSGNELYPAKFKKGFRLKQFVKTPLINQIICDEISLHDYCNENKLSQEEVGQIFRKEFMVIKNYKKENKVSTNTSISRKRVIA